MPSEAWGPLPPLLRSAASPNETCRPYGGGMFRSEGDRHQPCELVPVYALNGAGHTPEQGRAVGGKEVTTYNRAGGPVTR